MKILFSVLLLLRGGINLAIATDKSADSPLSVGEILSSSHPKYREFESTSFVIPETASISNTAPPTLDITSTSSSSLSSDKISATITQAPGSHPAASRLPESISTEYSQTPTSKVDLGLSPSTVRVASSETDSSTQTDQLDPAELPVSVSIPYQQGESTESVVSEPTLSTILEAITTSSVLLNHGGNSHADSHRVAKQDNIPLGQCRDTRLTICKGVVPYRKTTLPNMVGDTTYNAVNRSLPFFQLVLKSQCNKRMLQLACAILEPRCVNFRPLPPCRKFCRVATYGCGEYIPATLPISNVFSCERYPDSNDPSICVNLAKNEECMEDEFQCPDKTCIPKEWHCDGVRDCVFAVDESNCSASNTACTKEEFQCDSKCVPGRWRCDGEKDCQDGTDEIGCAQPEVCGPSRFSCADGSGCIPRRWVCDGKAECRDGSDERDCSQKECAKGDYRCSSGICIPSVWRCDGQDDCKDNSDEINCGVQHGNFQHLSPSSGDASKFN